MEYMRLSKDYNTLELATEPTGKLLRKYAMPSIIAMTASSLYNIVDSIFVGRGCGALAFSGLAVTFPLCNILAAFGSLVGVGGSALVSIRLGQKDYKTARLVLGNVIMLNVILGAIVGAIGLIFLDPILRSFGATDETLGFARSYMIVTLVANVFTHLYYGLNGVLRAAGHPQESMYATIVAIVLNIILDPIFIFVFRRGVQGAAIATVIAQLIAIIWQFTIFCRPKEELRIQRDIFHLKKRIVSDMLAIGLSPCLMNLAGCAVVVVINNQLLKYGGDLAIGAYGVINRVTFIFCMIVMGLNQGMQPIVGYNYGAQRYDRMLSVFRQTALCATVVTTSLFLCAELIPEAMVRIFSTDENLLAIAIPGIRIVCAVFFLNGYQMVAGNFFTSIGMAKMSIFLSLTRQVLYLIPLLLILPSFWGINGVWWSMSISDFIACLTAAIVLFIYVRRFKSLHHQLQLQNQSQQQPR